MLKGFCKDFDTILNDSLYILGQSSDRILLNRGYTLLSEFKRFLRKKWQILVRSLSDLPEK
jgi:hypothetical protein